MPLATEQDVLRGDADVDGGSGGGFVVDDFDPASPEAELATAPPLATPDASDIEVEILPEPEKPAKTQPKVQAKLEAAAPPEVGTPEYTANVKARIDEQTRKYNTEKRARESVERERDEAVAYARSVHARMQQAERVALTNQNGMVFNAKGKLESDLANAEREYENLLTSTGPIDPKAMSRATRNIAELAQKKSTLDSYRELQYSGPSVPEFTPATAQRQQESSKPIAEAVLWANRNPLFKTDDEFKQAAFELDGALKEAGDLDPRSPEFFAALDRGLRDRFPAKFQDGDSGNTNGNQPSARQSPPAQRRSGGVVPTARTSPNQPTKVTLTASEAATADRFCPPGMDRQKFRAEYARNKLRQGTSNTFEVE